MTRETSLALRVGVPVTAGAVLLVAAWLLHRPAAPPAKPAVATIDDHEIGCVLPEAAPMPTNGDYDKLAACLEKWNASRQVGMKAVSVDDVRHWVEVEHDPVWLEKQAWWFPLSGEGETSYPSGLYISVPLDGSACSGALVN